MTKMDLKYIYLNHTSFLAYFLRIILFWHMRRLFHETNCSTPPQQLAFDLKLSINSRGISCLCKVNIVLVKYDCTR